MEFIRKKTNIDILLILMGKTMLHLTVSWAVSMHHGEHVILLAIDIFDYLCSFKVNLVGRVYA